MSNKIKKKKKLPLFRFCITECTYTIVLTESETLQKQLHPSHKGLKLKRVST